MQVQIKHFTIYSKFFSKCTTLGKKVCNDCLICQLNKRSPHQKQLPEKQYFEGQSLFFNHITSFDTKSPRSPSSEGNSYKW